MPSKPTTAVPVHGECPDGHVIKTTAAPGRSTWRGECPADGCTHLVVARRVPTIGRGKAAAGSPATSTKKKRAAGAPIRKAAYVDDETPPSFATVDDAERKKLNRKGSDERVAETLGVGPRGAGDDGPAEVPGSGPAGPAEPAAGRRRRFALRVGRRRTDAGSDRRTRGAAGEIIPGIYN